MRGLRGFQELEEQGYPSSSGDDLLDSVEKSFIKSADDFADSADSSQYIHQKEISQDQLNAASESAYKVFRAGQRRAWVSYEPNRPKKVAAASPWISRFRTSQLPASRPEWNPLLHLKSLMKTLQDVPDSSKEEKIIADIIMKNCASPEEPSEPPAAELQTEDEVVEQVGTKSSSSSSSSHMNDATSQQAHHMSRKRVDDEDDETQVRLSPYLHDLLAEEIIRGLSLRDYRCWTTFPPWKDEQGLYA